MADNIAVTQGSGTTVAADDVGGVLYQRIKLAWGIDGAAVDASATNPLPVTSSVSSLPALPAGSNAIGTVGITTINSVAPAFGTGVRGATVQRVTIATDDVVPASQSGTWNIGTLTNLSQFGGAAINLGAGAVNTGTLRITEASDSPLVTTTGAVGDSAWASGSGTVISLLKAIATSAIDTTTDSPVAVHQPCDVVTFTPTLDTSAYASGDVLFATAAVTVSRAANKHAALMSLTAIDKSDQKPAFTIYFFSSNVTSGAFNVAPSISDADGINCLGYHSIAAADWKDLGAVDVVSYKSINLLLEPASGTQTVYAFAVLDAGTPTFANGDLVLQLGVVQE